MWAASIATSSRPTRWFGLHLIVFLIGVGYTANFAAGVNFHAKRSGIENLFRVLASRSPI
jgi:hypothetical protein